MREIRGIHLELATLHMHAAYISHMPVSATYTRGAWDYSVQYRKIINVLLVCVCVRVFFLLTIILTCMTAKHACGHGYIPKHKIKINTHTHTHINSCDSALHFRHVTMKHNGHEMLVGKYPSHALTVYNSEKTLLYK